MYNAIYTKCIKDYDIKGAEEMIKKYIDFTTELFQYFDDLSNRTYNRKIRQIYLCHTNLLNAVSFEKLIMKLKKQGYSFISLEKALEDKIYQSKDYYSQQYGISWLYRWIEDIDERIKLMKKEPSDKNIERRYNKLVN
jgi:hypothetical protein